MGDPSDPIHALPWPDRSYFDSRGLPRDPVLIGDWEQIGPCRWRGPGGAEVYVPSGARFIVTGVAEWSVDPKDAEFPSRILSHG